MSKYAIDYFTDAVQESFTSILTTKISQVCLNESYENVLKYFSECDQFMYDDELLEAVFVNVYCEAFAGEMMNKLKNSQFIQSALKKKEAMTKAANDYMQKQLSNLDKQLEQKHVSLDNVLRKVTNPEQRQKLKANIDEWAKKQKEAIKKRYDQMKTRASAAYNGETRGKENPSSNAKPDNSETVNESTVLYVSESFITNHIIKRS